MGKWKRYIPDGMKDILFDECNLKLNIERCLRKVYKYSGFYEIISPTLEFYDVFNSTNQSIPQEKMYKLFDSAGRILVLRPDMTTPIGRITSTKLNGSTYPLKLCYTSNIFRINENLNGKMSEITQSGVEVIGVKNSKTDAQILITAIKALLQLGLKNFKIELGQANFFKALIENINLHEEEIEKLRKLIENKNSISLSNFLREKEIGVHEEDIKILEKLPQLFGNIEIIDKARSLTKNPRAIEALDNICEIYSIIEKIGLSSYIAIDLGMVQNLDYYTGVIFKGYADEVGDYILSGGRYDNLIEQFGSSLPATGFAINVDNIMMALMKQNPQNHNKDKKICIFYKDEFISEAYKIQNTIIDKEFICELSLFDNEEKSLEYCKDAKLDRMISILDNNVLKIYNIKSEEIRVINIDEFETFFKSKNIRGY